MNKYIEEVLQNPKYKKVISYLEGRARRREAIARKESAEREKVRDIAKRIERIEKMLTGK